MNDGRLLYPKSDGSKIIGEKICCYFIIMAGVNIEFPTFITHVIPKSYSVLYVVLRVTKSSVGSLINWNYVCDNRKEVEETE